MSKERFQRLEQEIIFSETRQGHSSEDIRWIIARETIRDSETEEIFTRSFLRHPGVAAIVPITTSGEILMIEQFRYSAGRSTWEIPAGMMRGHLQDGLLLPLESPEEAAERELREEAGIRAGKLVPVRQFYTMPGTSDGLVYLFLAFGLKSDPLPSDVGEVVTRIEFFTIERALEMTVTGEVCDAKTMIGIYSAKHYKDTVGF
ncbi:MAG: NUDIX hydrolase [Blastocatellia bacterium]|nr:NUDIX hydrolase [Blastocatellia bacterium]